MSAPSAPVSESFTSRPARVRRKYAPENLPMRSAKCAINRSASPFRLHGAALGHRNLRRDFQVSATQSRRTPFAGRARGSARVHDQVSVSPDRRGEMRVAAKVEAEMAVIFRRIFRLRLRAQRRPLTSGCNLAATWPSTRLNSAGATPGFAKADQQFPEIPAGYEPSLDGSS